MHTSAVSPIRFNTILYDELSAVHPVSDLPLDSRIAEHHTDDGVSMSCRRLDCPKTAGVRMGEMNFGESMTVHFGSAPPGADFEFPILGYTFVYANKFLINVLDLHPISHDSAYNSRYLQGLQEVAERYRWIPKAEGGRAEGHEWAKKYDSGCSFYRWCDRQYLPDVEHAFRDYIRIFCRYIETAEPISDPDAQSRRETYMASYRNDYIEHDPGNAPLKTHFGERWAHTFLHEFLFAP